ncbi:hypothetical protein HBH69_057060 [Parastagonospora nodorum]|nr:hypothetical protein HBH69_057060 [Parastagonospora nodorum]KAH5329541.1 hypothetical protein HBI12_068450 [Parastagonospora nodorum]KAH5707436.1 hypothetical protein HBI20_205040 [Parastagonospora nodorum]KAH6203684.1 hypothetical protein HBI43_206730 [Parastagonospora nodorum]KAH6244338.1 hypothetical protein HBI42_206140 [Parastagonospora nodorum]
MLQFQEAIQSRNPPVNPSVKLAQENAASQPVSHPLDTNDHADTSQLPDSPIQHFDTPKGLTLQVDFAWSKFRNIVSEKNGDQLTPLYIQHFRPTKPQLRFETARDNVNIASGTIKNISISAECELNGKTVELKPLARWKTKYNYLSTTLSPDNSPVAISWITSSSMKIWDFICVDANQIAIAKFSVNIWAMKQVGNFHFEKSAEAISKEARDEIVVMGLTLMYVMVCRMNNPLNLLGSMFAKPGRVDDGKGGDVELENRKDR